MSLTISKLARNSALNPLTSWPYSDIVSTPERGEGYGYFCLRNPP